MDPTTLNALFAASGVIVGAGLTTLGSYLTTRANTKSVQRQLEHAVEMDERQVRARLREHWLERRAEAHFALLADLNLNISQLRGDAWMVGFAIKQSTRDPQYQSVSINQDLQATVELLAARETGLAAHGAAMAILLAQTGMRSAFDDPAMTPDEKIDRVNTIVFEASKAVDTYSQAARKELGVYE